MAQVSHLHKMNGERVKRSTDNKIGKKEIGTGRKEGGMRGDEGKKPTGVVPFDFRYNFTL